MKNFISLLTAFLCCLTFASAQNTLLTGRIVDEKEFPLEFANVLLLQKADTSLVKGTVSDSLGQFVFDQVQPGQYFISATMVGAEPAYSEAFELQSGQATFKVPILAISQSGVDLDQVVVKGQKPFMELKNDRLVMNVENSPVAAGNNALEVLAKAPGVSLDQDNRISLKGNQGVLVMIDGKNTYMSTEEVVRMLENMPANSIESIEIIHNPSSKYDAAGNAGIINIKLKKDKNLGLNGNVNLSLGQGNFPKRNGSLSLNYRNKKFNAFGSYSYWYNKRFQDLSIFREIPFEGDVTFFDQFNHQVSEVHSHRFRAGADFFISKKTTIGVLFNGRTGTWSHDSQNNTLITGDNSAPYNRVEAGGYGGDNWDNYTYNINLKHQFDDKGRELTFDADYSDFQTEAGNDYFNYFLNAEKQQVIDPNILRADNYSGVTIRAAKLDYSHPFEGGARLEAGWKSSFVSTDNNIQFLKLEDGNWINDTERTNQFLYEENIHAAYLNFNTQIKKVNVQLGLRSELTDAMGNSVTLDEQFTRDYFSLFPSLSVSHAAGKNHQFSYSFSRRINRPSYQDLNPFIYFLDQFTFGRGNTNLGPEFANTMGLNYTFKGRYMVNLSYNHTTDAIQEVLEQNDEQKVTFQTNRNLAKLRNYSITLSAPVTVAKWWNTRVNFSGFLNQIESPFSNGDINKEQTSFYLNLTNNLSLPGDLKAQISGFYQSKIIWGIFNLDPRWSLDVGVSKSIWQGKGSIRFNVNDLFNTNQTYINVNQGTMNLDINNIRESRRANLTLTYNFGNKDVKPARRRSTATEEEQNRVKSGN